MTWNLFIDDERDPLDVFWAREDILTKYRTEKWVICRNKLEVMTQLFYYDMPKFISFDHDLGDDQPTGFSIAKLLVELDMDAGVNMTKLSSDFDFYVHSQNPVGKANIEGYLNGYLKSIARAEQVPYDEVRSKQLLDLADQMVEGNIMVGKLQR